MTPPPEQVRDFTIEQIAAADAGWQALRGTPEYLQGREAVIPAAGHTPDTLVDLIAADAGLSALAQAVRNRMDGNAPRLSTSLD